LSGYQGKKGTGKEERALSDRAKNGSRPVEEYPKVGDKKATN